MVTVDSPVFLNGRFMSLDEARISPLDRGFLFGDGVYEVIPAYGGRLFRLCEHITRLETSLTNIRMEPPYSKKQWSTILPQLLRGTGDQSVYIQVTRGADLKRDHAIPCQVRATVFAMVSPIPAVQEPPTGVSAITLEDTRGNLCHIKATTLLANILMRQNALDQGCAEAILMRRGIIVEGAASNVFAVVDNCIITPPKSPQILPGITRDLVLDLARSNDLSAEETTLSLDDLKRATEIWLTSSTREILPVVILDGAPVGGGETGPLWRKMRQYYQEYKYTPPGTE